MLGWMNRTYDMLFNYTIQNQVAVLEIFFFFSVLKGVNLFSSCKQNCDGEKVDQRLGILGDAAAHLKYFEYSSV